MADKFVAKYTRILQILPDVAKCTEKHLVLIGGTALALFYLKHRVSVDLDFVPISGDEKEYKEKIKGCLSKKGYNTRTATFTNQFVIQFEDTTIKFEIFYPTHKIAHLESFDVNGVPLLVASLDDLLKMKIDAYSDRKNVRDLFDLVFILKNKGGDYSLIKELIKKYGSPINMEEIRNYILNEQDYEFFKEVTNAR